MPIPSDLDLIDFYNDYNDIRANTNVVKKNALRNLDLISKYVNITPSTLLLDFGCGNGEFVKIYGENCYGVELSNKNKHNRIVNHLIDLSIDKFDCITLFGVLEHLNSVKETMLNVGKYLKKDGCLVITTVDAESLIPYYYKPPEHLTYWTYRSFQELATLLKLEIIYYEPYKMVQYGDIYLDRLLARTPNELKEIVLNKVHNSFPEFVEIPTNEVFVIMKKVTDEEK
jgi:SAM-dependent methyltransferase